MVKVEWDAVESWIWRIVNQIDKSGKQYDTIYGVRRGGWVPAVMLSHQLAVDARSMEKDELLPADKRVLVVDEIYDSGKTIAEIASRNPHADFAVLIHKAGLPLLNYYGRMVDTNEWFEFPWERKVNGPTYY